MHSLELKVPPPVVALCFAAFMWLAFLLAPTWQAPLCLRAGIALVLAAIGLGIAITGMVSFRRAGTTTSPFKPFATSSLVTGGVYRYTRNPMYVGLALMLVGWAAFLASPFALVFLPAFASYLNRFQISPEERALASRFGAEYSAYRMRVRRWL